MSADFWAGYISGVVGIVIGNPLDVLKVRLQAAAVSGRLSSPAIPSPSSIPIGPTTSVSASARSCLRPWITGTAAPVLGYGALNALLFVSYNRTESFVNNFAVSPGHSGPGTGTNLYTTWIAGAVGGLATWVVSTPTELIKCRAQLASPRRSSWAITKQILQTGGGVRGLYFGGTVTALRDSIGYGFYFWSYELSSRWLNAERDGGGPARVLLCGGLAGIVTWASIFPLDVVKTRMQTQGVTSSSVVGSGEQGSLIPGSGDRKRLGAWDVAKDTYKQGGIRPFFRGLAVCSVRAFIVNAVQWAVYEWIMLELGQGRKRGPAAARSDIVI
ncbi:mitochondrial carrier domain-containing protein [Podospora didyma]|uniref:Mitochondrial carrier domain-containing protein n=1 Tax=Podospora didyma TaxID=330526 RepID=A0AAE0TZ19_9PEZI|nr:mitochondrial carrier domain-containing protein [Podospora didyma]